ncbi:TonB-dependent receptor [Sphingobium chlorophenolicum L-1]|uniref:TonB-dependent receptor n=1 Tax=Sphingobium chlorophenolicum L-1 TaxID=690566 RepID=F6EWA6_SPHCR|nr:TonB-dependent receptor [Sphingobium chlorophenolicum]AEG49800.1 TonB-dependent receptor [Sphingobium chlorophenolicum L-1]
MKREICMAFVTLPLGFLALPAFAQSTSEEPQAVGPDEIIVTAQRIAQSLQKVPISITAVTGEALTSAGVATTMSLPQVAPGLVVTRNVFNIKPFMRGVGSALSPLGIENPVAIYVDNVYMPNTGAIFFSFSNVDRIEVLRGPQGTLFGRNATGGLINVITSDPSDEFELKGEATFEKYSTTTQRAYISGALSENVSANIAFYNKQQGRGWGRNLISGQEVNSNRETGVRSKLRVSASESLSFVLTGFYTDIGGDLGLARATFPGSVSADGYMGPLSIYDTRGTAPTSGEGTHAGVSLRADLDIQDNLVLQSTTAWQHASNINQWDIDGSPLRGGNVLSDTDQYSIQQEILLTRTSDAFDLTTGLFFFHDISKYNGIQQTDAATASLNVKRVTRQRTRSYAGFAQATIKVDPRTNITAGLRYTRDEIVYDGRRFAVAGNANPPGTLLASVLDLTSNDGALSWRFGIDHELSDRFMVYASYNRGFKSGGVDGPSVPSRALEPEQLDAYEVGFKSEFFDRMVRLNVGSFYYDYRNVQLSQVTPSGSQTLNAARAESYGGEAELRLLPEVGLGRLEIGVNMTLSRGTYKSFPNGPIAVPRPATCTPTPTSTGPATGGNLNCSGELAGRRMVRLPDWTASASFNYTVPIGSGQLGLSASYAYNDGFFWEPANRIRQKRYGILGGEISYGFDDNRYKVRLFGRNLTDTKYLIQGSEGAAADLGSPGEPMAYGIGFGFNF